MRFAALEIRPGETAHQVVRQFMEKAQNLNRPFNTFELLGVLTLGRIKFVRFRTDCKEQVPVLEALDRGYVYQDGGSYALAFPGQSPGSVSITAMQAVGDPGIRRVYRGPSVKFWERQFL